MFVYQLFGQNFISPKFWILEHSTEQEIGSEYPQIQEPEGGWWDVSDEFSAYGQITYRKSPSIDPPFGTLILHKGAKPTDVLSASMFSHHGFVISERTKDLLEKYSLGAHWMFPVKVRHNKEILNYYVFHTNNVHLDLFDQKNSLYQLTRKSNDQNEMEIVTLEYLKEIKNSTDANGKHMYGKPKTLILLKDKIPNTDIIADSDIGIQFFVSDRLKRELIEKEISGISIVEQDLIK